MLVDGALGQLRSWHRPLTPHRLLQIGDWLARMTVAVGSSAEVKATGDK
jgi:hypothetical protein